jgi:hypothetical protein
VRAPEPIAQRLTSAQRTPTRLHGLRVVATPTALDLATWRPAGIALRVAADEMLAIGSTDVDLDDPSAIIEPESAFVGWWLTPDQFATFVVPHLEWTLPMHRPSLAQGLVAGVPLKLWLEADRILVITSSGLAHEAVVRLFGPAPGEAS